MSRGKTPEDATLLDVLVKHLLDAVGRDGGGGTRSSRSPLNVSFGYARGVVVPRD